ELLDFLGYLGNAFHTAHRGTTKLLDNKCHLLHQPPCRNRLPDLLRPPSGPTPQIPTAVPPTRPRCSALRPRRQRRCHHPAPCPADRRPCRRRPGQSGESDRRP